ncbi:MAG: enoyl-CoA hydratase/isomerase family protein [bacterium]|nr:enoyl-CoA hydratase/isomerase family protein [bacterium]
MTRRYVGKSPEELGFENLIYTKVDGVATVMINRPKVFNALNWQTLRELAAAFEDVSWDDTIGVMVLTGAGEKAFCTGADLDEQTNEFLERPRDYWKWMGAFIEAHERLKNIGKPTIARLNGIVVGGGNEFNIACDFAVAADDVYIRQVGPARGSVPAGGATQWLPLIIGDRRAREMLLLCEELDAKKAHEWGLINEVVPREELDTAVDIMAKKLLRRLPNVTRYTKTQLNFWRDLSWGLTVQHARDWLGVHTAYPEIYEGMRAFQEKRQPNYRAVRGQWENDDSPEYLWGAPTVVCSVCKMTCPSRSNYCPHCGHKLGDRE